MNEKYLLRLQEDLRLKNFTKNTCDDYYRFVKRFLNFTGKEAMSITYADIRKFIFHMKDTESKKASTVNVNIMVRQGSSAIIRFCPAAYNIVLLPAIHYCTCHTLSVLSFSACCWLLLRIRY